MQICRRIERSSILVKEIRIFSTLQYSMSSIFYTIIVIYLITYGFCIGFVYISILPFAVNVLVYTSITFFNVYVCFFFARHLAMIFPVFCFCQLILVFCIRFFMGFCVWFFFSSLSFLHLSFQYNSFSKWAHFCCCCAAAVLFSFFHLNANISDGIHIPNDSCMHVVEPSNCDTNQLVCMCLPFDRRIIKKKKNNHYFWCCWLRSSSLITIFFLSHFLTLTRFTQNHFAFTERLSRRSVGFSIGFASLLGYIPNIHSIGMKDAFSHHKTTNMHTYTHTIWFAMIFIWMDLLSSFVRVYALYAPFAMQLRNKQSTWAAAAASSSRNSTISYKVTR